MLPKGTVGLIGNGAYAYAMAGMCAYDVEVPVTDLEPHGADKTLGIGYEKLRLLPRKNPAWKEPPIGGSLSLIAAKAERVCRHPSPPTMP